MQAYSRREFGQVVMAGVPLAVLATRPAAARRASVPLGVATSSFRDLPRVTGRDNIEDILRAVKAAGASRIELALSNVEPAPPSTASFIGGTPAYPKRVVLSAEEIAATNKDARAALRAWRLTTPPAYFEQLRATLAGAGLIVEAAALPFDRSFSDAEFDAVFTGLKALGVSTVSSSMTMDEARRVAPFAERYGVRVAIHNQVDGNAAGQIATADLDAALALSPAFHLKLDVGNLTAADRDAVAELRIRQTRVAYVLIKDRRHHGGASQAFGEGDTPMAGVLAVLAQQPSPVSAIVEYDYPGLRAAADEVAASLAYLTRVRG